MLCCEAARLACEMRPHLTKRSRIIVNVIWSLIYFYTNILRKYSLWSLVTLYNLLNFPFVMYYFSLFL